MFLRRAMNPAAIPRRAIAPGVGIPGGGGTKLPGGRLGLEPPLSKACIGEVLMLGRL